MLSAALRFSLFGWRLSIVFLLPAALLSQALRLSPLLTFGMAALALILLASLLGDATEQVGGVVCHTRGYGGATTTKDP